MYFYLRRTEERRIRTQQTLFNPTKGKIHGVCKFNAYWFFTLLFTPIKGRIDSLTVYINKAETCINILRYKFFTFFWLTKGSRKKT
jgi:hypothetical protein